MYEHVRHQQGRNHAESDELARSVVFEVSHRRRAMQLEENCLQSALDGSSADVSLEHLHRYRTTSLRALLKQLSQLHRRNSNSGREAPRRRISIAGEDTFLTAGQRVEAPGSGAPSRDLMSRTKKRLKIKNVIHRARKYVQEGTRPRR